MSISITMPSLSRLSSLGAAMALHSPRKHHFHSRSKSMPSTLQLQTGHPILTEEFERLEESCSSSSSCFGTDWLAQALEVLVSCYSHLSNTKMEVLGSKWMNAHLDDILHLLEVCNLLRDTIGEIRNQHVWVQAALRGLGPALSPSPSAYAVERVRTALSIWLSKKKDTHAQLEKCMSILRRMAEKVNVEDKAGAAIGVNHAKTITIVICSTLVAALSFKTSHMRMPSLPLPSHFSCLHHKLKEAFEMRKRSSRSLHELEAADIALANLNNLLNSKSKLHLSPSTLALNELEIALPLLEHKINKLFKSLISTRVALLNTLSSQ